MLRPWVDRSSRDCSSVSNCDEFRARTATVCDRVVMAAALALLVGANVALMVLRPLTALVMSSVCWA